MTTSVLTLQADRIQLVRSSVGHVLYPAEADVPPGRLGSRDVLTPLAGTALVLVRANFCPGWATPPLQPLVHQALGSTLEEPGGTCAKSRGTLSRYGNA